VRESVLALDAAGAACSVALWRAGAIAANRRQSMARGHAEALMPLILETLAAGGAGFADLDRIAVGVGPGSFTGIRIALAAARGIALAADLPIVGVDSFSAVAAALPAALRADRALLVAIDSKRDKLFGRYYDTGLLPLGEALTLTPEALLERRPAGALLVAGDGAPRFVGAAGVEIAAGDWAVDATSIALLAAEGRAQQPPRPLYLRPAEVTLA
jgi:tRNA threonylcarbamoyladenosine biosynthesis protein TsaB